MNRPIRASSYDVIGALYYLIIMDFPNFPTDSSLAEASNWANSAILEVPSVKSLSHCKLKHKQKDVDKHCTNKAGAAAQVGSEP